MTTSFLRPLTLSAVATVADDRASGRHADRRRDERGRTCARPRGHAPAPGLRSADGCPSEDPLRLRHRARVPRRQLPRPPALRSRVADRVPRPGPVVDHGPRRVRDRRHRGRPSAAEDRRPRDAGPLAVPDPLRARDLARPLDRELARQPPSAARSRGTGLARVHAATGGAGRQRRSDLRCQDLQGAGPRGRRLHDLRQRCPQPRGLRLDLPRHRRPDRSDGAGVRRQPAWPRDRSGLEGHADHAGVLGCVRGVGSSRLADLPLPARHVLRRRAPRAGRALPGDVGQREPVRDLPRRRHGRPRVHLPARSSSQPDPPHLGGLDPPVGRAPRGRIAGRSSGSASMARSSTPSPPSPPSTSSRRSPSPSAEPSGDSPTDATLRGSISSWE